MAAEGDERAKIVDSFKNNPRKFFGTDVVGINLGVIVLSATGAHVIGPFFGLSVVLATIIIDYLILAGAEILPKTLALAEPTRGSLRISKMLRTAAFVISPLAIFITWLLGRFFNTEQLYHPVTRNLVTESQIVHMIEKSAKDGEIDRSEGERAVKVVESADRMVYEIMTPRSDLVYLTASDTLREALHIINMSGFSRLPVLTEDGEDTIGFIAAKDLLKFHKDGVLDEQVAGYTRELDVVPETKNILVLLKEFQASRKMIALVVNEHGTITGHVSMEDILEEVMGEIYDEYDFNVPEAHWVHGTLVIPGSFPIDQLARRLKVGIEKGDYDTVAGFILHKLGKIPHAGDHVKIDGWVLVATHISRNRITRIIAKKSEPPEIKHFTPE